jgi:hypothetical protein
MTRMPFGKHRGQRLEDVPHDYLRWCLANLENIDFRLRLAMQRALGWHGGRPGPAAGGDVRPVVARVEEGLKAWYRRASLKYHPDRGGSNAAQIIVNDCYESLCGVIGEIRGTP